MHQSVHIPEPRAAKFLFSDTRIAWVWLVLRVYVGWEWLVAGWDKVMMPSWVGAKAGTALQGFLTGALGKAAGPHPDVSSWYATFISGFASQHAILISYLVSYGELLVGVALILGAFTGIAAFFGAFMNVNYLFAGTVSVNPLLLLLELVLMFAWRNAGWWGIDRWLLPRLGAPWKPGEVFE